MIHHRDTARSSRAAGRRPRRLGLLTIVLLLLLSACASPGTGTPAPGTTAPGTTAPPAATGQPTAPTKAGAVVLDYWNPFTGPDGRFMETLVARYNRENTAGDQVRVTTVPQYYDKLGAAAASDTLPDILIVHLDQVATQAARNVIRELPSDAFGSITGSDYPAAVWSGGEFRGRRYAIPLDIHPMVMYYNQELFRQADIAGPPKTRAEFEAAAQKLAQNGQMGFAVTTGFPIMQEFLMLLHQFGGSTFNGEGTEITWNSDAGVRALSWLKEAQTKYARPNLPVDAGVTAFKQGTSAIEWNGIWQLSNLTGEGAAFGQAAPVPQIGDRYAVWAGSHQLALARHRRGEDAAKTAAAGRFMTWLTQNSVEWAKGGQIPASKTVRDSAEFKAVQPQATIAPSVDSAFFPPSVPGITDTFAELEKAVINVMAGRETDIKRSLDDAAGRGTQLLNQNRQRYGNAG